MTDVLRPQLYDRLEAKLGPVRVSRPGEALVEKATTAWAAPRGRAAPRPGSRVLQWGETYTVCCPFCRDRSFRLSVNHSWASPDPRTGRERLWLAKCFHENCLAGQPNRLLLRHLVFGLGVLAPAPVRRVPPVAAAARGPAGLPAGFAPLHELPPGHRARQYVLERGHDPDRLGRDLGVGYCEWAPPPFAAATDRLVVPLVVNGGLAGWQARRLDDDAPAGRTPKWWTSPGTEKAALLYNHDAARGYPIVVVVEGVADAWAVGPCAVALLGHAMSPAQERLLAAGWAGGVAVMLLDNDGPARPAAQDQNRRCRDRLARHVPGGVVLATLPEGADPGGLSRSAVWALILSAAAAQGVGLPFARLRDVVPHGSGTHPPAAPPPGRDPAAVAARLLGLGAAGDARPDDLVARVDAAGMGGLYREVELPAEAAAVAMRRNGVGVDVGWLRELDFELGRCQALTRERIWASAGRRLNPESDADVAAAVRHLAGGGGPGVAAGQSPGRDRFVKLVEVYCDLRRAASTAAGLLLRVDPGTGRVHCDLDPLGAATGRFTCADPPLQSLPRELRGLVVAGPGHVLVGADFSQVELRVLAHLSQDPELLGALRRGIDLHRRTAAYALGVPEDAVTAAQRDGVGKAVNFGVVYGQTASGLARKLGTDRDRAEELLAGFFAGYPGVRRWIDETRRAALRDGSVATLYGRRRELPGLRSGDPAVRDQALRQAVNTVVQGTAAEVNKLALARLHRGLDPACRLVLTVHDSVLVEVPAGHAADAADRVRRLMEVPPRGFTLPLPVAVGVGATWAECERRDG